MFEFKGLDQVNWRALRDSYGSAEHVPDLIRDLNTDQDHVFRKAFDDLLNVVNHEGYSITDVTAATTPFLIQLLDKKDVPKRAWILDVLINFQESCDEHTRYGSEISESKSFFATFIALEEGIEKYLVLLADPDDEIRALSVQLLTLLRAEKPNVRLRMWKASQIEANLLIRAAMIYGVGKLIGNTYAYSVKRVAKQYRGLFQTLLVTSEESLIRIAAASAWIESHTTFFAHSRGVPSAIPGILCDALTQDNAIRAPFELRFLEPLRDPVVIIERLRRLDLEGMAESLHANSITSKAAHLIIRKMLDQVFMRVRANYLRFPYGYSDEWKAFEAQDNAATDQYIYAHRETKFSLRRIYMPDRPLNEREKLVVDAIVNCGPFWQLPTNLFSFFYGLPDSRDELRALLAN